MDKCKWVEQNTHFFLKAKLVSKTKVIHNPCRRGSQEEASTLIFQSQLKRVLLIWKEGVICLETLCQSWYGKTCDATFNYHYSRSGRNWMWHKLVSFHMTRLVISSPSPASNLCNVLHEAAQERPSWLQATSCSVLHKNVALLVGTRSCHNCVRNLVPLFLFTE